MRTATTVRPAKTKVIPPCPATSRWILPRPARPLSSLKAARHRPLYDEAEAADRLLSRRRPVRFRWQNERRCSVCRRPSRVRNQNWSISLQETHSGAGLEELEEEASDEAIMKRRHLALISWTTSPRPLSTRNKRSPSFSYLFVNF